MQLVIHCGLDKAGSTAIQAHVALFREWLLRNGIYLPASGLSGFGHVALFSDLSAENWQPLLDELSALDQAGFTHCFFSYEGICKFDDEKLAFIKRHLVDYEVTVLFYLREQAEILQSGYLQQLKSARHPESIAHLNHDHALLVRPGRDYFAMLEKFESVFGSEAVAVRLYQPARWRDGSIIWDLLEYLECPPDSQFTPARQRQNISLDIQSAGILNLFDSYSEDTHARKALVEDLLWMIDKYPGGSQYFLDQAAVQYVRKFFLSSNTALARHYGIEFDYRDCVADAADAGSGTRVSYVAELAKLACYPRWRGEPLDGSGLAVLLRYSKGWSRFENWGVWSLGDTSQLEFRLPRTRFTGFEDCFLLRFSGRYFGANRSTQIRVNDSLIADADLRDVEVRVPVALLDDNRIARLELRHGAAVSPVALGTGNDKRLLAYGLQGLSYEFST